MGLAVDAPAVEAESAHEPGGAQQLTIRCEHGHVEQLQAEQQTGVGSG